MEFSRGNPCILRHDLPPPSSNDIPVAKGATPGDRAVGMSPCITLEGWKTYEEIWNRFLIHIPQF